MVQKTLQARADHYSTAQGGSQKGSHPAEAWWPMNLNRGPHSSTGSNPTEKSTPSLQLLTVERDQYPQQLLNICKSWGLRGLELSDPCNCLQILNEGQGTICNSVHLSCKWAQQLTPQESTRHHCHRHCAVPHSLASILPTEGCASAGQDKTQAFACQRLTPRTSQYQDVCQCACVSPRSSALTWLLKSCFG